MRLGCQTTAPVQKGQKAGEIIYLLNGKQIGAVNLLFEENVEEARYKDYMWKMIYDYCL